MKYDRCPNCSGPMIFHAITVARGVWARWMECQGKDCGTYVSGTAYGELMYVGNQPPPKNALARDEVYDGE